MARSNSERPTNGFTATAAADAVPAARRQVVALARDLVPSLQNEALETVELLASEVIANAVLHSAGQCEVVVTRTAERLRVEVTDTDPTMSSAVVAGPSDESGRGLLLVGALAHAWGMQPQPDGKTTWFDIGLETSYERTVEGPEEAPSFPPVSAVRRDDQRGCLARPVKSLTSSVPAAVGERDQAA
ncbi:ATP-binding protein [Streptomyces pseudovenezuelae]|uniref:ATP-binding protein n=1 Tax=Streptomyces pseudovenezuelae TaxID=67350 RepID=UPI003D7BA269